MASISRLAAHLPMEGASCLMVVILGKIISESRSPSKLATLISFGMDRLCRSRIPLIVL